MVAEKDKTSLFSCRIIAEWGARSKTYGIDPVPSDLIGARIVSIGRGEDVGMASDQLSISGGGLFIDYLPANSKDARRIILQVSELGVSVLAQGESLAVPQAEDSLQK